MALLLPLHSGYLDFLCVLDLLFSVEWSTNVTLLLVLLVGWLWVTIGAQMLRSRPPRCQRGSGGGAQGYIWHS